MLFRASFDKTAVGITIFITALFAFIIGILYIVAANTGAAHPIYVTVILLLIYALAFAFHPAGYKITGGALIICRPIMNVQINRTDIKTVAIIDKKMLNGAIRTFGVGGLFGYYGSFASYTLGSMTWYATRKDKAVLITTTNNKKIVITPDDQDAFVVALNT